jgi:hypothetical protein
MGYKSVSEYSLAEAAWARCIILAREDSRCFDYKCVFFECAEDGAVKLRDIIDHPERYQDMVDYNYAMVQKTIVDEDTKLQFQLAIMKSVDDWEEHKDDPILPIPMDEKTFKEEYECEFLEEEVVAEPVQEGSDFVPMKQITPEVFKEHQDARKVKAEVDNIRPQDPKLKAEYYGTFLEASVDKSKKQSEVPTPCLHCGRLILNLIEGKPYCNQGCKNHKEGPHETFIKKESVKCTPVQKYDDWDDL